MLRNARSQTLAMQGTFNQVLGYWGRGQEQPMHHLVTEQIKLYKYEILFFCVIFIITLFYARISGIGNAQSE